MPKTLKILVACERSGATREAFKEYARILDIPVQVNSIDIQDSVDDSPDHITGNFFNHIKQNTDYDFLMGHPPCTHITTSSAGSFVHPYKDPETDILLPAKNYSGKKTWGIVFFVEMWSTSIPNVALENPMNIMDVLHEHMQKHLLPYLNVDKAEQERVIKDQVRQAVEKYHEDPIETEKRFRDLMIFSFDDQVKKAITDLGIPKTVEEVKKDIEDYESKHNYDYHPWNYGHHEVKNTRWWCKGGVGPIEKDVLEKPEDAAPIVHGMGSKQSNKRSETLLGVANALALGWLLQLADLYKIPYDKTDPVISKKQMTFRDYQADQQEEKRQDAWKNRKRKKVESIFKSFREYLNERRQH